MDKVYGQKTLAIPPILRIQMLFSDRLRRLGQFVRRNLPPLESVPSLLDCTLAYRVKYFLAQGSVYSKPGEKTSHYGSLLRASASVSLPFFVANSPRPGIDPRPPLTAS